MCEWLRTHLGVRRFADPPGGFDDVQSCIDVSHIGLLKRHDPRRPHCEVYEQVSGRFTFRSGRGQRHGRTRSVMPVGLHGKHVSRPFMPNAHGCH